MGTTTKGIPYPEGTDRVMDGDNAIKASAEKVDALLPVTVSGSGPATDASSFFTITHTLGTAPTNVLIVNQLTTGSVYQLLTDTYTATTVRVRVQTGAGALVGAGVTVTWRATLLRT